MKRQLFLIAVSILSISFVQAQQEVRGRVTDARDGTPISGVSISVKGTNIGTSTNAEGRFSLRAN